MKVGDLVRVRGMSKDGLQSFVALIIGKAHEYGPWLVKSVTNGKEFYFHTFELELLNESR